MPTKKNTKPDDVEFFHKINTGSSHIAKLKHRIKKYIEIIDDQQLTIDQGLKTVKTCDETLQAFLKHLEQKDEEIMKLKSDNLFKQAGLNAMNEQVEKLNKRFKQFKRMLDIEDESSTNNMES